MSAKKQTENSLTETGIFPSKISRRQFLKMSGESLAAAGLAYYGLRPKDVHAAGPSPELASLSHIISGRPAWINEMNQYSNGFPTVSVERFKNYWQGRETLVENPSFYARDRMFHQLSTPVGNLFDLDLDFDQRGSDKGQGFGFSANDLSSLQSWPDLQSSNANLKLGRDGRTRGWAVIPASKISETVSKYLSAAGQTEITADDILANQLGTVSDQANLTAFLTHLGSADPDGTQHETLSDTNFTPSVENLVTLATEQVFANHDLESSILLAVVVENNNPLFIAYTLGPTADNPTNPSSDQQIKDFAGISPNQIASGARFLPSQFVPDDVWERVFSNQGISGKPPDKPPKEKPPKEKLGNPGNTKSVGSAGENPNNKGDWNAPPDGPGDKGMSDGNKGDKGDRGKGKGK